MKRTFLPLLLTLVLVMLTGCGGETAEGIKMPFSSGVCKGEDYQEILSDLEKAGFTNVETEIIDDLITGWTTKDGEVEQVSVDGEAEYDPDARYAENVKIVITYHTFPQADNPDESDEATPSSGINPPYDNDSVKGLNYLEAMEAFKSAGFVNINTEKRFETAFGGYEESTVANIYINNSGTFSVDSSYDSNSEVRIDYYVISDSDPKSDTELTQFYAQTAIEKYGEDLYPYGFKCHWIADLKNAEQNDDGSWFLKVGVTIENEYGNKLDTVAEGTVSGTDQNPKVEQFYVSN